MGILLATLEMKKHLGIWFIEIPGQRNKATQCMYA